MSVATVQLFYALLAVVAQAFVVGIVLIRVLAIGSERARGWYDGVAAAIIPNAMAAAWLIAALATAGSLYFSEVAHFEPCRLCWYQRIAMYPLVVILGIGAARRDRSAARYSIPLAAIGAAVAAYHVGIEWIPALDTGACDARVPCNVVWFREFGYISLPVLALTAFLAIVALLSVRPDADRSAA